MKQRESSGADRQPRCSVVAPVFNEREIIPELVRRIASVLESLGEDFELILVNDGSTDDSLEILRGLSQQNPHLRIIDLSRNFGHQAALYAGLCRASGQAVVLMDGDLQDPPEVLPRMIELWEEGHQVVYAVRRERKEGLLKRVAYAGYYRLLKRLAYIDVPLDSGDFSLLDEEVVSILRSMPERSKFLRGLRSWVGFSQVAMSYERHARPAGKTKYTLVKLLKLGLDGVFAYSYIPLRVSFLFGALVSVFAFGFAAVYLSLRLFADAYVPQGFTTLAILILFLGGVQLLSIGLLGEYLGRVYEEVKRRPEYIERELIGFDDERG